MLTRSISVSCADESLGFGDDRDFAGPRPLTRGLAPPPRETSEPPNEMSTTHAVVRARGCGAGGAQPVFKLLGEQPLAANIGQRFIENSVTARHQLLHSNGIVGPAMRLLQKGADHMCLHKGQRRCACANIYLPDHHYSYNHLAFCLAHI